MRATVPTEAKAVVAAVKGIVGRSERSNKSDRIDADWLTEQLRLNPLKSVHHGSTGVATLKQLVR